MFLGKKKNWNGSKSELMMLYEVRSGREVYEGGERHVRRWCNSCEMHNKNDSGFQRRDGIAPGIDFARFLVYSGMDRRIGEVRQESPWTMMMCEHYRMQHVEIIEKKPRQGCSDTLMA